MAGVNDFMMMNPQFQSGLAMMAGESPSVGLERARYAQQMMAEQRAQQQQAQAREALSQGIAGGLENVDASTLRDLALANPDLALKILEMQRQRKQEAQRMEMLGGMMGAGSGGNAGAMAAYGAMTGDPTMIQAAQFMQQQQKESPEFQGQVALAKKKAAADAENISTLESSASKLPQLVDTVNRLSEIGKTASYTERDKAVDYLARQIGQSTEGSVARTEYESIVANQVLPLLRDTFGAAFTAAEGERLLSTLGNPDKSPQEKDASLRAFIRQKMNDVESLGKRYGYDTSYINDLQSQVKIGGDASPAKNKPQANISTLRKQAQEAIAAGRDAASVGAMFKQMTGEDF